jgi:hypothetical protein
LNTLKRLDLEAELRNAFFRLEAAAVSFIEARVAGHSGVAALQEIREADKATRRVERKLRKARSRK